MATLNFDASQVQPSEGGFEALPAGWYNAAIDESVMKPTRDGMNAYLQLRFNIVDGQYQGRKVFVRLNIQNSNPVAQEIAYKDLSAICHATGQINVGDSQQLHNIPMKIRLKLKAAEGQYEASNEVSAYRNINDQTVGTVAGAAAAPMGATPAAVPPPVPAAQSPHQVPPQQPMQQQPVQQQAIPAGVPPAQPQQPWAQAPEQAQQPQVQQPQQWQQPAAQQPWQQPAEQPQQPVQQPVQAQAPAPQGAQAAVPPWQQQ